MQIELGQHVRSTDEQDIGKVKQLILDPSNGQVKTLVVEKGFFLPEDIEVPLTMVQDTGDGRLHVAYTAEQVKSLPRFIESQYAPLLPEQAAMFPGLPYTSALWPIGYPVTPSAATGYPVILPTDREAPHSSESEEREIQRRRAEESSLLAAGDVVYSKDGEMVGEVHGITFDSSTGKPTRLVIRKGWLFHQDQEISGDAIESLSDGAVTLKLTKVELEDSATAERHSEQWSGDNRSVHR